MESKVYLKKRRSREEEKRKKKEKKIWTHERNCSLAFWMLLPPYRNVKLRRETRDLRTGVSKYIEVDGGIFEYVFKL
jgi:hypothetical protein